MKKILIINGHPDKVSLCFSLAESYKKGVDLTDADCKLFNLIDLKFSSILTFGYRKISELEPDLVMMQQEILSFGFRLPQVVGNYICPLEKLY